MENREDVNGEGVGKNQPQEEQSTLGFPIVDPDTMVQMKNIPPSVLPHFHGKVHEDPNAFLFEFDILCRSYDYSVDVQKLKLFPTTLKDSALRWYGIKGCCTYFVTSPKKQWYNFFSNSRTSTNHFLYHCKPNFFKL